eukprot:674125-Amphidinium_carterae.5
MWHMSDSAPSSNKCIEGLAQANSRSSFHWGCCCNAAGECLAQQKCTNRRSSLLVLVAAMPLMRGCKWSRVNFVPSLSALRECWHM